MKPHDKAKAVVNKMSETQIKDVGQKAQALHMQAHRQLTEYKMWLRNQIQAITHKVTKQPIDPVFIGQLLVDVDAISIDFTRVEDGIKARKKKGSTEELPTVSVMYSFPDLLMQTFREPPEEWDIPKALVQDFKAMQVIPENLPQAHDKIVATERVNIPKPRLQ